MALASLVGSMLIIPTGSSVAETPIESKRIAILIANSTYPDSGFPQQSAAKDAAILADELGRDSFEVDFKKNLSRDAMRTALDGFLAKVKPGTTALLYFNGVGIQVARQTYLIPVNAEIWAEGDVKREGTNLDAFVADMNRRGATVKIIIVDASRRNPFERRFRAYSAGLASLDAPDGTLVMYAAAPNKVGPDSTGEASLFMNELVKELRTPNISAEDAIMHTRIGVSHASNGEQVPWFASSLVDPIYFSHMSDASSVATPQPDATTPTPPTTQDSPLESQTAPVTETQPAGPVIPIPTEARKRPTQHVTKPPSKSTTVSKAPTDSGGPSDVAKPDQAAEEKAAEEKAAKEKAAKDQAAKDKAAKDQAAKDQAAKDQAAKDQAAKDQAAKDQAAKDKAASEKAASDKVAQEKAASDKAAGEKAAKEKAAREKVADEKAAQEKAANDKAAKEKSASEKAAKETVQSDKPGTIFRDCPDCPEMMVLEGGAFLMGSGTTPFDRPPHRVKIAKPFAIARDEVTFADWARCMAAGGCTFKPDSQGFGEGDHPVINVSWTDAKDFVTWLSKKTGKTYRLPSEAQWEYAAHGGTTTPFSWGSAVGTQMANCADCGLGRGVAPRTMPVRSFAANPFGLFDMAGNAAEWVEDCWNASYKGAPKDGSAWVTGNCEQRVLRGGSFDGTAAYVKPSARFRYDADVRYWANGFRVMRDIP